MENTKLKFITVQGVNNTPLPVLICKSESFAEKNNAYWYTTDNMSEVGEDVVIENTSGARVSAKRIK